MTEYDVVISSEAVDVIINKLDALNNAVNVADTLLYAIVIVAIVIIILKLFYYILDCLI